MKKELKSGILSADKSDDCRPTVGGANVIAVLSLILDNINIRFCTKLYRQIVDIPMGTNCAPLVADLFLFCYERDFMKYLSSRY